MDNLLVSGLCQVTTAELDLQSARAASGLASLGIGEDDGFALFLRNDLAFFEASWPPTCWAPMWRP